MSDVMTPCWWFGIFWPTSWHMFMHLIYIYIYQSQLSVSSANAVLQTKKQNWKVFLGSWSLVPQENQFQEVSMIVIEYKVLKSENPRPMIQINFPEFNFPGWITNIRLTDPNHGLCKITKTVFLQGARESVAKSGETILTSVKTSRFFFLPDIRDIIRAPPKLQSQKRRRIGGTGCWGNHRNDSEW